MQRGLPLSHVAPRPRPFDKLKGLPRFPPKFVELVETNPEVTSAVAPHPDWYFAVRRKVSSGFRLSPE